MRPFFSTVGGLVYAAALAAFAVWLVWQGVKWWAGL